MKKFGIFAIAAAFAAFGAFAEIERNTNSYVRAGVTYAQRGGMDAKTYVVTNVDITADDVGAVSRDENYETVSNRAMNAVQLGSQELEQSIKDSIPSYWALANVTNASGRGVSAADVGAVDTNAVRNIILDEITPATNSLNQTLSYALDDKRDEDDLNVYYRAFTGRENWTLKRDSQEYELEYVSEGYWKHDYTEPGFYDYIRIRNGTNFEYGENVGTGEHAMWYDDYNQFQEHPEYIDMSGIRTYVSRTPQGSIKPTSDRLATTNGVAEAISANEKTGTNEQVVRGELWQDSMWLIEVENADLARRTVADEEGYNIMDTYATKSEVDDKADRATTLLGYGITDAYTKMEVVPLWVAGNIYNAGDIVLYDGSYYRSMFDETSSPPDNTFTYWEPITFENVNVYDGLTVCSGDLSLDNGELLVQGGGITVDSGFEIKRGNDKVVYGISVNGGAAQHGDVSIDVPTPGNYSAVSNAAMWASNEVASIHISAANPTFSNAVLAVGLNIDTNTVAVLNEIASTFGDFPITGTATTVGGLLAALAAAIAWMKKNKVGSFGSVGGASATVENGVAKLDDFFTNSNGLLTATIDERLPYPLYAVPSTGLLKDRAINTTSLASVTVPENFTDLLVRASVASSLAVTMPEAIATKYGDTFPGEAGEYLITITKTGASEAYVRTIKLEEVA